MNSLCAGSSTFSFLFFYILLMCWIQSWLNYSIKTTTTFHSRTTTISNNIQQEEHFDSRKKLYRAKHRQIEERSFYFVVVEIVGFSPPSRMYEKSFSFSQSLSHSLFCSNVCRKNAFADTTEKHFFYVISIL